MFDPFNDQYYLSADGVELDHELSTVVTIRYERKSPASERITFDDEGLSTTISDHGDYSVITMKPERLH